MTRVLLLKRRELTRQKVSRPDYVAYMCFIYDMSATFGKPLPEASTNDPDARVRQCTFNLQDESLIEKLTETDKIATEAKYHV